MRPSRAIAGLPRSGIREIFELALRVPDAIHLEVGEPSFPTPGHVCEAAAAAAREGHTKYTPNAGIPELREVLARKVRDRNGIDAEADRVIVTPGAVAGLFSTLEATVDPGDEVLMGDPSWPNYGLMVRLLGATPRYFPLRPEAGMVPEAEIIERHVGARTRVLVLNSPGNPTGATTPRDVLVELLELAREHDLWVLSDEVYDEMWFEEPPQSAAPLDVDGRVVTFFSFSKTYAMTGWRVGYLVAPPGLVEHVVKAQEPITSCVNAPAQHAAIAAVTGPQDCVAEMRSAYRSHRDLACRLLDEGGVPYVRPSGAFYLMVDVSASGLDGGAFARRLVLERGVAVVPGITFGPGSGSFVRVSLASARGDLTEGLARLVDAVHAWSG